MKELSRLFLRLGTTAFGGPAAHIAMMEEEVVRRRGWLSHERFIDLLGATNLIPGPNSTEMALHIGYVRAGMAGLLVAGGCFIIPAVVITLAFAHLYVTYSTLPALQPFLAGIRPAMIAVILAAVSRLAKPIMKQDMFAAIGIAVLLLNLFGVDEVMLLLAAGLLGLLWGGRAFFRRNMNGLSAFLPLALLQAPGAAFPDATLTGLGLFFLKIGSILYGSGYVLVAYIQGGLVDGRHWLTQKQLVDAIAVGQFTPGPVLSTATFVGYLLLGVPGAAVATLGIFLPSFIFVALTNPLIGRLRKSAPVGGFLDGVNAASLALMIAVTIRLGLAELTGFGPWMILAGAALCSIYWKVNAAWIVIGAAAAGWLISIISH